MGKARPTMAEPPGGRARVAFIGLGTMGLPMARRLVEAGYDLVAYDIDAARADAVGADVAHSAAEAARDADVVITSLPSPDAIDAVLFGDGGVHEAVASGTTFIDMSTNAPRAARSIAARFADSGVGALDAPVSGGPVGAANGSLSVMVGGDLELFERWQPLLSVLGKHVVHIGPTGTGQIAKLCNNLITAATMEAISEACAIAAEADIDAGVLYGVLCNSVADSRVLRTRFPLAGADSAHPVNDAYSPLFMLGLLLKDVRLAVELAHELGVDVPVVEAAATRYEQAQALGHGPLDYSAVYLLHDRATRG
jgi:3-hydroxyisobutyrate dehydrogenase